VPLLPIVTDAGGSVLTGWPIMTALNMPEATTALKWGAGALTFLIGFLVFDALSRVICMDERQAVAAGAASRMGAPARA
jgi:hypothetical protein